MNTKVLVVGGSGFIGSHLVDLLKEKNYEVMVFDVAEPRRSDVGWVQGNIVKDVLDVKGYDCVFACSGILGTAETFSHIEETVNVNIHGMLRILEAGKQENVPIVYISLTNNWLNPYTITKQAANRFCQMYAKEYGTRVTVLKALNAYGEYQAFHAVKKIGPSFILSALRNEPLVINGSGNQVVDMIYAGDIAEMMVKIYERGIWGEEFDGGTGVPMTVNEVAEKIIELAGSASEIVHKEMRSGEPIESITIANPARMKQLIGYYPQTVFSDGMKKTIEWYRKKII